MIFTVPGWDLEENDNYKLLIQLLGVLMLSFVLVYIALSSRKGKD